MACPNNDRRRLIFRRAGILGPLPSRRRFAREVHSKPSMNVISTRFSGYNNIEGEALVEARQCLTIEQYSRCFVKACGVKYASLDFHGTPIP
jgi:hypothetical protein